MHKERQMNTRMTKRYPSNGIGQFEDVEPFLQQAKSLLEYLFFKQKKNIYNRYIIPGIKKNIYLVYSKLKKYI